MSNDPQKLWIVWMLKPCGSARERVNSKRARLSSSALGSRSINVRIFCFSAVSSLWAQPSNSAEMRLAISAAAALVNVKANRLSGGSPNSNRRKKRLVNTRVFPVPALAATQALVRGFAAARCLWLASALIASRSRVFVWSMPWTLIRCPSGASVDFVWLRPSPTILEDAIDGGSRPNRQRLR